MVKAVASYRNGEFVSLTVSGHAGYAEKGSDIVCSAYSAIAQGGLNALAEPERFKIEIKEGFLSIEVKEKPSDHDKTVIDTIVIQLESIAESYPAYAVLERK